MTTTDTPRTDAVMQDKMRDGNDLPALARELERELAEAKAELVELNIAGETAVLAAEIFKSRAEKSEAEVVALTSEVERLRVRNKKAEDLIRGLHGGWKKARKAHLETCKNAQREIDKLHAENVCLQELIQEFYEWSRRDYPTEQEVREIMNRYHDLLNK